MSGSHQTSRETYTVEVEDEAWEGLSSLPLSAQEKVTALWRDHTQYTPTKRIPGKLKELRGVHKGLFQFDITKDKRMIYRVDEDSKTVYIEHIGGHPEWRQSKGQSY